MIELIVCSTTTAPTEAAAWDLDISFVTTTVMNPAEIIIAGIEDSNTSVRSHPCEKEITNPPKKEEIRCMNVPT